MTLTSGEHELVEAAINDGKLTATGWLRCTCPFCFLRTGKHDSRRSLSVQPGEWFYRCWRCRASGKLKTPPVSGAHLAPPDRDPSHYYLGPPEGFLPLHTGEGREALIARVARRYLEGRGVPERTWGEAAIGVTFEGRAARRVVVPVFDPHNDEEEIWMGWVGRAWERTTPSRYMYPAGMPRGDLLYNARALRVATDEPALVVEGVFDALPHWPDACACLGKPTEGQIQIMLQARRPLLVALDGDAWTEGEALAMRLQLEGLRAAALRLPPRTDPGNFRTAELFGMARLQSG